MPDWPSTPDYGSQMFIDVEFRKLKGNEFVFEKVTSFVPRKGDAIVFEGEIFEVLGATWSWYEDGDEPSVTVLLR